MLPLRLHLELKRVFPFALCFVLTFFSINIYNIHKAQSELPEEEPYISLDIKKQTLGDVLKKIAQGTGYIFEIDNRWSNYPVNISLENVPLNQALKLILRRFNHAIIYESEKRISILIYAEVDTHGRGHSFIESIMPETQENQAEPAPSSEPLSERADDLQRANEKSTETSDSEQTGEKDSENKESAGDSDKKITKETSSEESKDNDSTDQSQSSTVQEKVAEESSPDTPQN